MKYNEFSFDKLPEAVAYLIEKVTEIKSLIENRKENPPDKERTPIGIDKACEILQKAKPTIYALVRKGLLPCYKRGKKLFFFEDELLSWIRTGKKKTIHEIVAEMKDDLYPKYRKR